MPTPDEKKTINDLTTTSTSASNLNVMVQGTSSSSLEKMSATDLVNDAIDDDVLMSGDEVPTNPATVNADQLNGVPDTGYVKKYSVEASDWDTVPTNGSNKPVTSDGVYDAINAINTRVTNIEETLMGENEVTVQYPDDGNYSLLMPNKVPLRALKFAEVPTIKGKTRAWNQLVDFSACSATGDYNGITYTKNNDGTYTISGTPSANSQRGITPYLSIPAGHKVLVYPALINSQLNDNVLCYLWGNNAGTLIGSANIGIPKVYTMGNYQNQNVKAYYNVSSLETGVLNVKCSLIIRDLTLILNDWQDSDITTANIPLMVQQIPDLLKGDAYDAGSLVDTEVSGVKSIGFNRLDLATYMSTLNISKTGDYYVTTANDFANKSVATHFPVDFKPNTRYSFRVTGYVSGSLSGFRLAVKYTDGTTEELASVSSSSLATGTGTSASGKTIDYVTFTYGSGGTSNFSLKSLTVSIGTDTTKNADYKTDTLSLPLPVTLRGIGTCVETLDLETGVLDDGKFAITNLGGKTWDYFGEGQGNRFATSIGDIKSVSSWNAIGVLISSKYVQGIPRNDGSGGNMIYGIYGKEIYIRDTNYTDATTFKNAMDGVYLLYEKATYTPSSPIEPIPYNFLEVEGGGTVETIQTQTPVIDNCLDVIYDIIPQ